MPLMVTLSVGLVMAIFIVRREGIRSVGFRVGLFTHLVADTLNTTFEMGQFMVQTKLFHGCKNELML